MMFYRNNLTLVSSLRGRLMDFLSYTLASNTQINFIGFTALDGEIFTGTLDYSTTDGVQVVDADPIGATGLLLANTTDFNVGVPFTVNKYPGRQFGDVMVFLDGWQQFRNTGNSSTNLDGNYYEVDAGNGLGTIIRFNVTDPQNRNVLVSSNGLVATRPTGSMMAVIEAAQGQINNMASYVAALAGQTVTTILGASPSNVDLKAFGDRVFSIENRVTSLETTYASSTVYGITKGGQLPSNLGIAAIADGFIGRTYSIFTLSPQALTSGVTTTLYTQVLPPGKWVIHAKVTGLNSGNNTLTDTSIAINLGGVLVDAGFNSIPATKNFPYHTVNAMYVVTFTAGDSVAARTLTVDVTVTAAAAFYRNFAVIATLVG